MEIERLRARLLHALYTRFRLKSRRRLASLMRGLEAIREPELRQRAFLRDVAALPPPVALETLHALEALAGGRNAAAETLFLALLDEKEVREILPAPLLSEIRRLGRIRNYRSLLETFFYAGEEDGRLAVVPPLPPDIRDIPLGWRKTRARTGKATDLERLARDNDAGVIGNLLANPRITEREVVRLAARRPNSPAILTVVASSRRWIARYAVKKALVNNPDTPISISLSLLKYLLRADLMDLRRSSAVALLKREAEGLLRGPRD